MARYKLTLAYEGTALYGSQKQARRRTVQAELEKAARGLGWNGRSILLAGRTDAGVHASGQVAAMDIEWAHEPSALRDALNAGLTRDIAVLEAVEVAVGFHPRFDAVSRRYGYLVRCAPIRHPLADRNAWRVWPPVRVAELNRSARIFVGRHDFGAFGSAPKKDGQTVRTVMRSGWHVDQDGLRYEIVADGFLYRMVRRLVFLQVAAGQGKCTQEALQDALESGRRVSALPGGLAPGQGLTLLEVKY